MSPISAARKLAAYPAREWHWAFEALAMLAWARFLIRFVPVRWWRARMGPIGAQAMAPLDPQQRAQAYAARRWIARVSAHVPFSAMCLPQALAARWMLARRGIATELHFGARPAQSGGAERYDLHAWLLCGDLCLTGAHGRDSYSEFEVPTPTDLRRIA